MRLALDGGTVGMKALMESAIPIERLESIRSGVVVECIGLDERGHSRSLRNRIGVERNGWYTRRTSTRGLVMPVNYAHLHGGIGPVFIHCGERPIRIFF